MADRRDLVAMGLKSEGSSHELAQLTPYPPLYQAGSGCNPIGFRCPNSRGRVWASARGYFAPGFSYDLMEHGLICLLI